MAQILHQLIGSLSHYLQGFIHPRWCRISAAINRSSRCAEVIVPSTPMRTSQVRVMPIASRLLPNGVFFWWRKILGEWRSEKHTPKKRWQFTGFSWGLKKGDTVLLPQKHTTYIEKEVICICAMVKSRVCLGMSSRGHTRYPKQPSCCSKWIELVFIFESTIDLINFIWGLGLLGCQIQPFAWTQKYV